MSMWYTCDPAKEFSTFLDGKPHSAYKRHKRNTERRERSRERKRLEYERAKERAAKRAKGWKKGEEL